MIHTTRGIGGEEMMMENFTDSATQMMEQRIILEPLIEGRLKFRLMYVRVWVIKC